MTDVLNPDSSASLGEEGDWSQSSIWAFSLSPDSDPAELLPVVRGSGKPNWILTTTQ